MIYAKIGTHPATYIDVVKIRINNIYVPILHYWTLKSGDRIMFREKGETIYMQLHGGLIDHVNIDGLYFIERM